MEPVTCSIVDAAKAIGVSRATLYNYLNAGKVEAVKVGGRRLVKIASVRALVAAWGSWQQQGPSPQTNEKAARLPPDGFRSHLA